MALRPAELILNSDGSLYHLNLLPEDLAPTIITVGDPERVPLVSRYFDSIEVQKGKREFITHTGYLGGRRLSVVSTGIGTDNIDIVINEIDALFNINLKDGIPHADRQALNFIRIGTSGAIQPDIPLDTTIVSSHAIGFDGLPYFYEDQAVTETRMEDAFIQQTQWPSHRARPYAIKAGPKLLDIFSKNHIRLGITATNTGFYGPQGRGLFLNPSRKDHIAALEAFSHGKRVITNLEMETAGVYVLSKLMGHQAISLNCILANRSTGEFSKNPEASVSTLIKNTLEQIHHI